MCARCPREVWVYVNERLGKGKSISHATIINFCGPWMRKEFQSRENGKGGHHSEYDMKIDEKEFRRHITRTIIDSMMREFPEETQEVLKEMISK